jgi:hypothetical protein
VAIAHAQGRRQLAHTSLSADVGDDNA